MKLSPNPFLTAEKIKPEDRKLPDHSPQEEVKRLAKLYNFERPMAVHNLIVTIGSTIKYCPQDHKSYWNEVLTELKNYPNGLNKAAGPL